MNMRALTVTIDWILIIALAAGIIWLIVALARHNKKMAKTASITCVVLLVLLIIACRIALRY